MNHLELVSVIWTLVALLSVTFAALVMSKFYRRWRNRHLLPAGKLGEVGRLVSVLNFGSTAMVLLVHFIFLGVGASTILFDEGTLRMTLGRVGILTGQFLLFLTIVFIYVVDRHAELRMKEDGDE